MTVLQWVLLMVIGVVGVTASFVFIYESTKRARVKSSKSEQSRQARAAELNMKLVGEWSPEARSMLAGLLSLSAGSPFTVSARYERLHTSPRALLAEASSPRALNTSRWKDDHSGKRDSVSVVVYDDPSLDLPHILVCFKDAYEQLVGEAQALKKVTTDVGLDAQFPKNWVLAAKDEAAAEPTIAAMNSFLVDHFNWHFNEYYDKYRRGNVVGIECLGSKLLVAIDEEGKVQSQKVVMQHFSTASRLFDALSGACAPATEDELV